jgi:uncharacterized membrane protein YdfJ with MMPL/SSD domain
MRRLMEKLDAVVRRHRQLVLVLWLLVLIAAAPAALHETDHLSSGGFAASGSQSDLVQNRLAGQFPQVSAATLVVVLTERPGAGPADLRRAATEIGDAVSTLPSVTMDPAALGVAKAGAATHPGAPMLLPLTVTGGQDESPNAAKAVSAALHIGMRGPGTAAGGRVDVRLTGQGALEASLQDETTAAATKGETIGFPVIAILLLAAFGSLIAAVLPLGVGIAAVVVSGAVVYLLSQALSMSVFVTNTVSMIGIGVAVDYSLFVLTRYRAEIRAGNDPEAARKLAMRSAGVAVLFSGCTVIVALAGLFLIGSTAINSLAIGAMVVVAFAMLGTATLLPVLLSLLSKRLARRSRLFGRDAPGSADATRGFWVRWSNAVMRRPVLAVLGSVVVLGLLTAPAFDLTLGDSVLRELPSGNQTAAATETAAGVLGPGAAGPVLVLVDLPEGQVAGPGPLATSIARDIRNTREVSTVAGPIPSRDGHSMLFSAVLSVDPEAMAARGVVDELRADLPAPPGGSVLVGGTTATIMDFDSLVGSSMWAVFVFLLASAFVLLLFVLRSVVLAVKAVLMNLLSVGAAYGVVVAVFQWGWLSFFGFAQAPMVDTILPPFLLAVVFGLSMDYEIILLSRIKERWLATGDNTRAVGEALSASARTITSAALTMIGVFLAFAASGLPSIERLGVGCAVGVAVDATIVRLVLVPALMRLFGRWNWWFPFARSARRRPVTTSASAPVEAEVN